MAEEPQRPGLAAETVRVLARETGITEQEIREIASMVGFDRASILREARNLRGDRRTN
jgi:PP-loop superfamily ATP-utilizing enzyme